MEIRKIAYPFKRLPHLWKSEKIMPQIKVISPMNDTITRFVYLIHFCNVGYFAENMFSIKINVTLFLFYYYILLNNIVERSTRKIL